MSTLFDPIRLGAIEAPNRILMAPLTRGRATHTHVPTPIMARYYTQRAQAGLIISEATGISQQGLGWPFAPGLWSQEQVAAWRPIVRAVHDAGGRIMAQLWHMGRLVHPSFLGGNPSVSASATTAPNLANTYVGKQPYEAARALETSEIADILEDYRRAAQHAMDAGFDGVQLHAANGYLIEQFLRDGTNQRTDQYGGSIENRVRLLVEATRVLIGVAGADRTAVRLSPNDDLQGCVDSNTGAVFTAATAALDPLGIAFLELRAPRGDSADRQLVPEIRDVFRGPLVLNQGYALADASLAVTSGEADAVAFGRPFIANPDLPARLARGAELAFPDANTFYSQGPAGYIDYPVSSGASASA